MDDQSNGFGIINLKWNVSRFLPSLPDGKENELVYEILDPKDFPNKADIQNYWSVPERLIDIRWLVDRIGYKEKTPQTLNDSSISQYIELEYSLYSIVVTIGVWSGIYEKNAKKLNDQQYEVSDLKDYWNQNSDFLHKCALRQNSDEKAFSGEELIDLYHLSKDLPPLQVADSRKGNFKTSASQLLRQLKQIYGSDPDQISFLPTVSPHDQKKLFDLAVDFCNKAVDFFTNPLWRKDSTSISNLRKLEKWIQHVVPGWSAAEADELSDEYNKSIWNGLQSVADYTCNQINGSETDNPISVEAMLQQVNEVQKLLGGSSQVKKNLKEYTDDQRRCVALLEMGNAVRVMTFSGFYDCEDNLANRALNTEFKSDTVAAFRSISEKFGADLVIFSTGVVDRIVRYELNSSCCLTNRGTLRAELNSPLDVKRVSFLKKSYACCERKILAELENRGNVYSGTAILHVKFAPCMKCYGALQNWATKSRIHLTLDYPGV